MNIEKQYILVDTKEKVKLLLDHIDQSEVIAYDTETDSLNVRKGNIVGFSVSGTIGVGFYLPTLIWNIGSLKLEENIISGTGAHQIAKVIIQKLKGKKIICHNASFDIRYTRNYYGIDLLEDLWIDTGLLLHTVAEEGAFGYGNPFALKSIAKKYQNELGLDENDEANQEQLDLKESIKRNGGTITKEAYEIYKADIEILAKYAAADTDLTLRTANYLLTILKEENLEKFFFEDEVMPIYREVTIPMEDHGIKLDIPLLDKSKKDIEEDMTKYSDLAVKELMNKKEIREWIVNRAIEAYPPSPKGSYAQKLLELTNAELPKTAAGKYQLTKKTMTLLEDGPIKTYLQEGDINVIDTNLAMKVSMELYKADNDGKWFNIQSKSQMGSIAFDALGMKPLSQTPGGKPQFDDSYIDSIAEKNEWAANLQIYNRLSKIKSTYIDRFIEGQDDGKYYFYFKQNGTVSGRYGSDLQQLPKPKEEGEAHPVVMHYTNLVRAFLISGEGYSFIDDDYSSLEPRVFAHVANDPNLKKIFNEDLDFYSHIAILTEKLEGVSAHSKAPNFLKKVDPVKRQSAKAYSLGIPYGMSAFALGKTLDIPKPEADKLVQGYLDGFPDLKQWMSDSKAFVKANGYIELQTGRRRHLPEVKRIYQVMGDKLMDWKVAKMLEKEYGPEKVIALQRDYKNGLNNAMNVQIQGLSASIVNRAAMAINRRFKAEGIDGVVVAQVHDQLICEVKEEDIERAKPIVQDCMENTTKLNGLNLVAVPDVGKNMKDAH
jgi:DNA polymerase I-like protein with 3'-5' exonuclease and polymerase domains